MLFTLRLLLLWLLLNNFDYELLPCSNKWNGGKSTLHNVILVFFLFFVLRCTFLPGEDLTFHSLSFSHSRVCTHARTESVNDVRWNLLNIIIIIEKIFPLLGCCWCYIGPSRIREGSSTVPDRLVGVDYTRLKLVLREKNAYCFYACIHKKIFILVHHEANFRLPCLNCGDTTWRGCIFYDLFFCLLILRKWKTIF